MSFFIVNNNYHFHQSVALIEVSNFESCSFIIIPHSINTGKVVEYCKKNAFQYYVISTYPSGLPLLKLSWVWKLIKEVKEIASESESKVFLFSEFEEVNCLVIKKLYQSGSDIFLVEDNGIASYVQFKIPNKKSKLNFKRFLFNFLVGVADIRYTILDNYSHARMPDKYFKNIIFSNDISIKRNIELIINSNLYGKPNIPSFEKFENALFINQDLYNAELGWEGYSVLLFESLKYIQLNCSPRVIYFRFHPRETIKHKVKIRSILTGIGNVNIIEDSTVSLVESLSVNNIKKSFSIHSSALLEIARAGGCIESLLRLYPKGKDSETILLLEEVFSELSQNIDVNNV